MSREVCVSTGGSSIRPSAWLRSDSRVPITPDNVVLRARRRRMCTYIGTATSLSSAENRRGFPVSGVSLVFLLFFVTLI